MVDIRYLSLYMKDDERFDDEWFFYKFNKCAKNLNFSVYRYIHCIIHGKKYWGIYLRNQFWKSRISLFESF